MKAMTDLSLTVRRTIKASPEQLYQAWLDPATMAKFMAGGDSQKVIEARSDATVGGGFLVVMKAETELPHKGIYKVLTPHSRMVFTWESPYSPADSEVELLFKPVAGGTEITLNQVKFLNEGLRDGHIGGWTKILSRLDALFAPVSN
jgi:uncharacterized protein YndB with AHSA1/START domain